MEGFYIYARQLDSDNDTYKMLTVLNGGGASTCTVNGLLKYQSYEFFIVPFYKTVEGKPSNSRIARTLEDGKLLFLLTLFFRLQYSLCFVSVLMGYDWFFCAGKKGIENSKSVGICDFFVLYFVFTFEI